MRENLTQTIEDYLKTIYQLTRNSQRASTNQIAASLEVTPASVTGMLKKLASTEPPLVEYKKHYGVVLTPAGEKIALEIVRHHRLLEMFLVQILGYDWDEVHAEADRLEHHISEIFEERIAEALGDPDYDPHGNPIPTRELAIPEIDDIPLLHLRPGQRAIVQRVLESDPELLRRVAVVGLIPGAHVEVLDYSALDANLRLAIAGQTGSIILGEGITNQVFVKVIA